MGMGNVLQAGLDYKLHFRGFEGKTLKQAIDEDVITINSIYQAGHLKMNADALCYLINVRSDKEQRLGRFAQRGSEYHDN